MPPTPPVPRPTWTRRVAAWSFLLFFVSLMLLTYFAVYYSNKGDLVTTGYLAALASVIPILFVLVPYYVFPIWAIPVPLPPEGVAAALSRATEGIRADPVGERDGPFARCVSVVRFDTPACTVGWYSVPLPPHPPPDAPRSTVVLRPASRDRRALAAFRETLARSLLESGPAPS